MGTNQPMDDHISTGHDNVETNEEREIAIDSTENDQSIVGKHLDSTRRRFMATGVATWASVSLAGCLGDDNDDDDAEAVPNFVVTDEVIAGSDGIPEGASGFVSAGRQQRQFVPGMEAIFKIGVWDPESGDIVSDEALTEALVDLDRDVTVDLEFFRDDREWSGGWEIGEDEAPGTVGYDVQVSNAAEFTRVGIAESELDIIEFEPATAANYVVTEDTYATEDRGGGYVQSCLPQHNFTSDMAIGFDIGIYDGGSGEPVGPDVVDEAIINFETGDPDEIELEWDDDGELWNYTWRGVPADFEGTLTYEVQVTNDGEFHNVGVYTGSVEIIEAEEVGEDPTDAFVVTDDTYATEDRGGGWVQSCLPQHNFTPDMAVGFDIGIYDGRTGDPVGPDVVDEATLVFADGDPDQVSLEWDDDGEYWNYTWRGIPDGYEGELTYEVQVTNDGEFHNVGVYQESIQVIPEP